MEDLLTPMYALAVQKLPTPTNGSEFKVFEIDACLFANIPEKKRTQRAFTQEEMKNCVWMKPELVAQIEFMEVLQRLNPVAFNYKADASEMHLGFIAEDVPNLVASKDRKG